MKPGWRRTAARRAGARDPAQANILGAIALVFGAGGLILPLPLGLAGILVAAWARWRHGRTGFGTLALGGAAALTLAGIVIGASL
jgi:hypothetical protein